MVFGYVAAVMGCKRATLLLAIPSITFWLLIYFGTNYNYVLFANFCGGWVTGGSSATIILYISEIANNEYAKMIEYMFINLWHGLKRFFPFFKYSRAAWKHSIIFAECWHFDCLYSWSNG